MLSSNSFHDKMKESESATEDMLEKIAGKNVKIWELKEKIEGKDGKIRELEERITVLETDKTALENEKNKAWKIMYAKNKEVTELKKQLEHEKSERENKDAKVELLLKENTLEMKHAGR